MNKKEINIESTSIYKELQNKNIELEKQNSELKKENYIFNENMKKIEIQNEELQKQFSSLIGENKSLLTTNNFLKNSLNEKEIENKNLNEYKEKLISQAETYKSNYNILKEQNEKTIEKLNKEFENISNKILKEQTDTFKNSQNENLTKILDPFKKDILILKENIEDSKKQNNENTGKIQGEIKTLMETTKNITQDAKDLTDALKGNKKIQGNWGENTLKNLLENVGMIEGINFETQVNFKNEEENKNVFLDFVLKMPNNKSVVIDSKVSLNNYINYTKAETDEEKKKYMKTYFDDIKNHIKELGEKHYEKYLNDTLEYTFMFLPLENAYLTLLEYCEKNNEDLFSIAYNKKVAIVTASSLFPIIRVIQQLWNIDNKNKEINKIGDLVERLCNKLEKFVESMKNIQTHLNKAISSYNDAENFLQNGKGNLFKTGDEIYKIFHKNEKLNFAIKDKNFNDD